MPRIQTQSGDGSFSIEGVDGTEHLESGRGRIDITLFFVADPEFGGMLSWRKGGGALRQCFYSKGDFRRRLEWVWTPQGTPFSAGFFIPVDKVWNALKQFIQSDGALPDAVHWVDSNELPVDTFPPPKDWKQLRQRG